MAYHWIPPLQGTLKINVHAIHSPQPAANGNKTGIGAVYRNSNGILRHLTVGNIPSLSLLGNQLWAIYVPLRRAMIKGYRSVVLETDNLEAFRVIRDFHLGAPAGVIDLVSQIDILLKDRRWTCVISYVFPARNHVSSFLARLGRDACDRLYTMDRMIGAIEELLDWDMGLGVDHPDYMDVMLPIESPDPVNFNIALGLADQVDGLGLGQENAQLGVVQAGLGIFNNANEHAAQGVPEANGGEVVGENEEMIQVGMMDNGFLFAGDEPLEDID